MKWYLVDVVEDGVATNKLIQASSFEEALENIEEQVGKIMVESKYGTKNTVELNVDRVLKFRKKLNQTADAIDHETRIQPVSVHRVQLTLKSLGDELLQMIVEARNE